MSIISPLRSESFCTTTPEMLVVDVDDDFLDRLQLCRLSSVLEHDARAADGEFEAFAAHVLDQNAQLQFAAAGDFEASACRRSR
jgi:hypothetical protein